MNLHEAMTKYWRPEAFSLSGANTVQVKHPDDVKSLKNLLKKEGLGEVHVVYFDGKRIYEENQLKSVAVTGECNDKNFVFKTMDELNSRHPFTKLIFVHPHPRQLQLLDAYVVEWARQKGIMGKPVYVTTWKLGNNAAVIRFGELFAKRSRTKPDMVVAFTNRAITSQVKAAQRAKVEVVSLDCPNVPAP